MPAMPPESEGGHVAWSNSSAETKVGMLYPMDKGTPVGLECNDNALAKIDEWMESGIASFDRDKKMVIKCAAQNYVFTTEQAAALISKMTWDDGQAEACAFFKNRLLNPDDADPLFDLIENEEARDQVKEMLKSCTKAETRELGDFPIEDDGVRDDGEVERFIAAIDDAGLESSRMGVVDNEMNDMPSPPFSYDQYTQVLDKISFSDEAANITERMSRIGAIYPMEAAQMAELLDKYLASKDKLRMLESMKPLIKDAQHKALLVAVFEFPDDKEKAEEILRDVFVPLEPEIPLEDLIRQALREIGTCRQGYPWRKVWNGYRCYSGGHFVSDAAIERKLEQLRH